MTDLKNASHIERMHTTFWAFVILTNVWAAAGNLWAAAGWFALAMLVLLAKIGHEYKHPL